MRKMVELFILVAIIFSIRSLKGNLLKKEKNDEISVLIDNLYINLTDQVYVENSIIYISEEDVKKIFDHTIYYNIGDEELITSYNNHVAVMHCQSNEMMINDSIVQSQGRNTLIKELYNQIIQNQYAGICIDFEEIDDINSFYRFLIELTPKFKEFSFKVMVKVNNQIDKEKVKDIVNLII